MTPPPPLSPDLLLAHASSLRALAHSLLRDAHAAEDALQETFARAIEQPPASLERLGGWLRAVLESVVRKRQRGELRRTRRERDGARSDATPAADESIERSEVLRTVLDAVLALDEPYREVVLDRYFEGRSPREIARRRQLSIHTVTSRLGRARGRLRERLERELGNEGESWRRNLCGAFGLPFLTPRNAPLTIGVIPGVIALSTNAKLVIATTLAALAGLGWMASRSTGIEPESNEEIAAAVTPELVPALETGSDAPAETRVQETQREALASAVEEQAGARALPPYRFPLLIEVRDGQDRPLPNAKVELAPGAGAWNPAGTTDARGRLELVLRGFRPVLSVVVRARTPFGQRESTRALDLSAGIKTGIALGLPESEQVQLILNFAEPGANEGPHALSIINMSSYSRGRTGRALEQYPDQSTTFAESLLNGPLEEAEAPVLMDQVLRHVNVGSISGEFEMVTLNSEIGGVAGVVRSSDTDPGLEPPEQGPRATGLLVNADGNGLAGVRIEARGPDGTRIDGAWTDEEGAWLMVVEKPVTTALTLTAGGGDLGRATTSWDPRIEPELRWNPLLDRGHELLGMLVDADGKPLADWIVEARLEDAESPWWDATSTDQAGRFALPNLPRRPLELGLRPGDTSNTLDHARIPEVWPGYEERRFELDTSALRTGSIRVALVGGDGLQLSDGDLRLWRVPSGAGVDLSETEVAGTYETQNLPPGEYRLVIGHSWHGFIVASSFQLAPGEALDLGIVALEAPAQLELDLQADDEAEEAPKFELWRRHDEFEALFLRHEGFEVEPLRLPPGRYELLATINGQSLSRAIALEAGERQELALAAPGSAAPPAPDDDVDR